MGSKRSYEDGCVTAHAPRPDRRALGDSSWSANRSSAPKRFTDLGAGLPEVPTTRRNARIAAEE